MKMSSCKTCPCPCGCKASSSTLEEIEKVFGWRGKITQSYCKKCRGKHKQNQPSETISPIYEFILKGINFDYQNTREYYSKLPKYDEMGHHLTHEMKNKLTKKYLLDKNNEFIEHFLKLLEKPEANIEEKLFLKFFKMYNFHTKKPDHESFFNFIISLGSKEIDPEQELTPKMQTYVILKIHTVITSTYMKILSVKLKNSSAFIISFVNDMNQDFIKNTTQIHILDRDMIKFLLKNELILEPLTFLEINLLLEVF